MAKTSERHPINGIIRFPKERLKNFAESIGFLFPAVLAASNGVFYFVVKIVYPEYPLYTPIRVSLGWSGVNFIEIIETPAPYILSISFVAALVGAVWFSFVYPKLQRRIILQLLIVPWIAVILTGPVWGLIWSVNHWPADGFSDYETMMLFRRTDVMNGLKLSWLSAAQSFPINIFSYLVYCGLLLVNLRLFCFEKKKD